MDAAKSRFRQLGFYFAGYRRQEEECSFQRQAIADVCPAGNVRLTRIPAASAATGQKHPSILLKPHNQLVVCGNGYDMLPCGYVVVMVIGAFEKRYRSIPSQADRVDVAGFNCPDVLPIVRISESGKTARTGCLYGSVRKKRQIMVSADSCASNAAPVCHPFLISVDAAGDEQLPILCYAQGMLVSCGNEDHVPPV